MKSRGVGITGGVALFATCIIGGVAFAADPAPSPVSITGSPVVGETLTASPGDHFRWQRCDPSQSACGPELDADGWTDIPDAGGAGVSTYTLAGADLGHLVRALGKELAEGSKFTPSPAVGPVTAAPAALGGQASPPVFDQTGNVEPTQGTVRIELPNGEAREIHQLTQIPVGSVVDVSDGHAILTTQKKPGGPLQSTEEWGAPFVFDQKANKALTVLTVVHDFGADRAASERRRHRRGLWGRGHCKCRTDGQNSSGTARGTFYLVKETDKGTFTKVKKGKVLVKDFETGEKILLEKGESYLAKD